MLISNARRPTSLYYLLSNNYINDLIDLPLTSYHAAIPTIPEAYLSELTTQFVQFLKALATRMNGDTIQVRRARTKAWRIWRRREPADFPLARQLNTASGRLARFHNVECRRRRVVAQTVSFHAASLGYTPCSPCSHMCVWRVWPPSHVCVCVCVPQFFLSYPSSTSSSPKYHTHADSIPPNSVKFPLYSRALEFCAHTTDSLVRTTAMNICLNTLRLSTDKELPTRDTLAIAVFSCSTSLAAALISPVCFQMVHHTSAIKEQIASNFAANDDIISSQNKRKEQANIKSHSKLDKLLHAQDSVPLDDRPPSTSKGVYEKLLNGSMDALEELQLEVLLLDDILKVGLTALNEQAIEMVLAAFVYPLLLEPLLLCVRHTPKASAAVAGGAPDLGSSQFLDPASPPSPAASPLQSHEERWKRLAPARTALVALAVVFNNISNKPMLRLLSTALFHPLSPDATTAPKVARPNTYRIGQDDAPQLRLDESISELRAPSLSSSTSSLLPPHPKRSSGVYAFGQGNYDHLQDFSSDSSSPVDDPSELSVFILAPVLAQLLEGDASSTRPNPYRRVLLACMRRGAGLENGGSLQSAAALAFDAAITRLRERACRTVLEACGMVPRQRTINSNTMLSLLTSLDELPFSDDDGLQPPDAFPVRHQSAASLFDNPENPAEPGPSSPDRDRTLSGVSDVVGEAEDAYPPTPNTPERSSSPPPAPDLGDLTTNSVAEVISSLCAGLITTPARGPDNTKYMSYGFVCAHALSLLVRGDPDSKASLIEICKHYVRRSANYIANCCEDDAMLFRVFHAHADLIDEVTFLKNSTLQTHAGLVVRAAAMLPPRQGHDGDLEESVKSCAKAHIELDALVAWLGEERGDRVDDGEVSASLARPRRTCSNRAALYSHMCMAFSHTVFMALQDKSTGLGSVPLRRVLSCEGVGAFRKHMSAHEGSIELAGMTACPCLCALQGETEEDEDRRSSIVEGDDGTRWRSLFVVLFDEAKQESAEHEREPRDAHILLAVREVGSAKGKIESYCPFHCVESADIDSSEEKRLELVLHGGTGLFEGGGIDLWFEDGEAALFVKDAIEEGVQEVCAQKGGDIRQHLYAVSHRVSV